MQKQIQFQIFCVFLYLFLQNLYLKAQNCPFAIFLPVRGHKNKRKEPSNNIIDLCANMIC